MLATFAGHDAGDVSRHLAGQGINAPAGTFYAYEPARRLELGSDGGLRIGLAPYSDDSEVDRLLEALAALPLTPSRGRAGQALQSASGAVELLVGRVEVRVVRRSCASSSR